MNLCFKHMEKVLKHKDLENQLMAAKFQQSELKVTECKERIKQVRIKSIVYFSHYCDK